MNYTEAAASDIQFPNWKAIANLLISDFTKRCGIPTDTSIQLFSSYADKFELINKSNANEPTIVAMSLVRNNQATYESSNQVETTLKALQALKLGNNEFYTVFDISQGQYIYVDPNVEGILGIPKEKFTLTAIMGLDPEFPLHHPEDVDHLIRWAGVAYMVLSLPGFKFKSLQDNYRVCFRLNCSMSSKKALRDLGCVMVEKKSYLSISDTDPNIQPRYHIDRWTIYDSSAFISVSPSFHSNIIQSDYLNSISYVTNCELIGILPKYVLMLDEKLNFDRNKAVANNLNANLLEFARIKTNFTDNNISDYFGKTIRSKVTDTTNTWQKFEKIDPITSDYESAIHSRRLGATPIPKRIKELIYSNTYV